MGPSAPSAFDYDAHDEVWTAPAQRVRHVRHDFELGEGFGHGAQINGNSAYFWADASNSPIGNTTVGTGSGCPVKG